MDLSTVNNAVSDAASGLPSGWTQYVTNNIGTPAGQQAILSAAAQYGITDPATIASLVNQATGGNVTAAQVQAVAQTAPTPAPTPAPAASSGTPLSNITAAPQFVPSAAAGAVGTTYGQASTAQTQTAAQANPELATALTSGTAAVNYDANTGTYNLINTQTNAPIAGNYQVQVGPNGTGINIPSGNGMIQVTAQTDQSGTIAPVTAADVQNVGVNQGAGGFAGGVSDFIAAAGPAISVVFPEAAPYIAAYNSAAAADKGQYGLAVVDSLGAAGIYGAQNPDTPIGQMVTSITDSVNNTLGITGTPTPETPAPEAPATTTPAPETPAPETPATTTPSNTTSLSDLNQTTPVDYSLQNQAPIAQTVQPTVSTAGTTPVDYSLSSGNPQGVSTTGTGLNVSQNPGVPSDTNPLFNTSTVNPATGLTNGLGLQPSGSTNLASMNGAQGLTAPANTGASGTPTGVVGAAGVTPIGTGGLPTNTLTDQTLGQALTNANTGVTTPSIISPATVAAGTAAAGTAAGTAAAAGAGLTTAQALALGIPAAAAVLGTTATNNAISNAAGTQAAAGQNTQNTLLNLYNQQTGFQAPYQGVGNQAATTLSSAPTQSYLTNQFNNQDLNAQLAPNYAFQLQQGLGQSQNAANVGGGLLSGNTLQGLNTYAQNYAQGAYQNAFTNYQTQRQNIYSNLSNQAGIGQTANQQLSSLGGSLANTYGNVTTGLAASAAGAQTAQAVNNANLLSNLANTATVAALA